MHLRTVVSDLLRSKLQIQFHQYYQEVQKKDTQKLFPSYSHDKESTCEGKDGWIAFWFDMWTKTGLAKKERTYLFSIQSQEYNLMVDPGNLSNGVQSICRMNQETLNRSISSQDSQNKQSQAQFES